MDDSESTTQPRALTRSRPQPRPIRPAVASGDSASASSEDASTSSHFIKPLVPRRTHVPIACDACRKARRRCGGGQPKCHHCWKKGTQCVYQKSTKDALADAAKNAAAAELIEAIQNRDPSEAMAIFLRLRDHADPEKLLRQLTDGDLAAQTQLVPETRLRYSFPFSSRLPAHLQSFPNPYLSSLIYEWEAKQDLSPRVESPAEVTRAQYLKPFHTATVMDPRIDKAKLSEWTSVSGNDDMMRAILKAYFQYEYTYFTFFHIDCFLDDLVDGGGPSCSSLLVNIVLATGCHCLDTLPHRAENWDSTSLGYAFLNEAKRLWAADTSEETLLPKLQASMLMNLLLNISGVDKIGNTFLPHSAALATALDLFQPSTHIKNVRLRLSREYTAWCFFWWQGFVQYAFRKPVFFPHPPKIPLPDPLRNPEWYGEIWVKYPQDDNFISILNGHVQRARLEFGVLLASAARVLFVSSDNGAIQHQRGESLLGLANKFKAWYNDLPRCLTAERIALPSQIKLHIHYYNMMHEMQRLLSEEEVPWDRPNTPQERDLCEALARSEANYETLLRLYYFRHSFQRADMMLNQFLTVFAMSTINRLNAIREGSPRWQTGPEPDMKAVQTALILVEKGLCNQGESYYFPQTLFHVVMNQLQSEDAGLVRRHAGVPEEDEGARYLRLQHMQTHYPINTANITSDRKDYLNKLVWKYAEMGLQSDAESTDAS